MPRLRVVDQSPAPDADDLILTFSNFASITVGQLAAPTENTPYLILKCPHLTRLDQGEEIEQIGDIGLRYSAPREDLTVRMYQIGWWHIYGCCAACDALIQNKLLSHYIEHAVAHNDMHVAEYLRELRDDVRENVGVAHDMRAHFKEHGWK